MRYVSILTLALALLLAGCSAESPTTNSGSMGATLSKSYPSSFTGRSISFDRTVSIPPQIWMYDSNKSLTVAGGGYKFDYNLDSNSSILFLVKKLDFPYNTYESHQFSGQSGSISLDVFPATNVKCFIFVNSFQDDGSSCGTWSVYK